MLYDTCAGTRQLTPTCVNRNSKVVYPNHLFINRLVDIRHAFS